MPTAASPTKANACALALPPRLSRMIVDSEAFGAGEAAADIAAVLTERGLGGDSADLDARLDQFRRDRSQRASSARELARRWAAQVASNERDGNSAKQADSKRASSISSPSPLAGEGRGGGATTAVPVPGTPTPHPSPPGGGGPREVRAPDEEISTGVMLAFAFPDRVARNRGNGSFMLSK